MKHLKIKTCLDLIANSENKLLIDSINTFLETLLLDIIKQHESTILETIDVIENQDFLNKGTGIINNQETIISIGEDSHLTIEYSAYADFEYNKADERSVGGGRVGDICDVENSWVDCNGITFYVGDGSEIDLSDSDVLGTWFNENVQIN